MPRTPAPEYSHRIEQQRATLATLQLADRRLSITRLAVFAVGALIGLLAWRVVLSPWWLLIPVVAFILLMRRHEVVIQGRDAAARAIAFYERGLARLEDRWIGTGEPGDRFRDDAHLYANDLDIFGQGSLFELLSIARTRPGEEALAAWLKTPAEPDDIRARHAAVRELRDTLDLRERIALAGSDVRASVDGEGLLAWARSEPTLQQRWLRRLAAVLTAAALTSATVWAVTGRYGLFLLVVGLEILYSLPLRARTEKALHAADGPARDLDVLAHVLTEIEKQKFTSNRLVSLSGTLDRSGVRASAAIRKLHRLVEMHDWQHNLFFGLFAPVVLWGTHLAFAIEHWRAQHGAGVGAWLETVGEFEALGSLAAYHYEHPEDPFPELAEGSVAFEGTALGHPLIPVARMVPNDVSLGDKTRLLVVSGSNMSGKSTLLRTVGINAVLAFAGAPVRATALRLTPLTIGATLRIQDSLQEGRSRFYAEITRLRALADLAHSSPALLFLLDELLHGTNSHDRLIGATGVLHSFVERGAIGLVTTHDLALTGVALELDSKAANVHFEDRLEAGEMRFDYRMKPGPVTRSNAIALMRAVGLDVDRDASPR